MAGVHPVVRVRFMVAVRGAQVEMTPAGLCRVSLSSFLPHLPPFRSLALSLSCGASALHPSALLLSSLSILCSPLAAYMHFYPHAYMGVRIHMHHIVSCLLCIAPTETAAKNLAKNVDFEEWLALGKADDDATVDQASLPWLPL